MASFNLILSCGCFVLSIISMVYASAYSRTLVRRELISLYNEKEEYVTTSSPNFDDYHSGTTAEGFPIWFITMYIIIALGNFTILILICYCCIRTWPMPLRFIQLDIQSFLYGQFHRVHNERNMHAADPRTAQQATEMNRLVLPFGEMVELSSVTT